MSKANAPDKIAPQARIYDRLVLNHPAIILLFMIALVGFFGFWLRNFKVDASSDSIVLENDEDLRYYDETREIFGSDDFVFITVTPKEDLFSPRVLERIDALHKELAAMKNVENVTSILTLPLFENTEEKANLLTLATDYKTLNDEDVDVERARKELTSSPIFRDYIISESGDTTAIQVNFQDNERFNELERRRYDLRELKYENKLTPETREELEKVERDYDQLRARLTAERQEDIEAIRAMMKQYEDLGEVHLGGVPMIVADIIDYVRHDIVVFGLGVLAMLVVILAFIFKKAKWVVLPLGACVVAVLFMLGYLGFRDWRVTIVTSNLTSILLIVTMAMAIHIVVRYREIFAAHPDWSNRRLTFEAVRKMATPCLYMAATTTVGFGSLIVSGIRPVMDFGLMMTIGLGIAYFVCFVFFPATLLLFPKGRPPAPRFAELKGSPMEMYARFAERRRAIVILGSLALFVVCLFGAFRLKVENRFIDYFHESSEIYQGMTIIDERLGGTTPLEVVIDGESERFWLEPENLKKLREIHEHLEGLEETGKVLSLDTMVRVLENLTGKYPSKAVLILIRRMVPEDIQRAALRPYVSEDFRQARISMRVRESNKSLSRKSLLENIDQYLRSQDLFPYENTRVTGVFVLYNNMLQSLFASQIKTIGMVFFAIWAMFLILFRSPTLATIGIIPNILPVVLVLGTLGWLGIPLDMMTIMIAAITLGIAVDDTIHYIHRFREEFPEDRDYIAAMYRCHNSIGRAMYYTSVTIIVGFSVLTLSEFIPTIYFGIFTGLAMIVALLAAVILLPLLIILLKPFGPGNARPGAPPGSGPGDTGS